jgi:glycosyltransferase involved in cell wall biosynthesis
MSTHGEGERSRRQRASVGAEESTIATVSVSVVIPCLDEAANIAACVTQARTALSSFAGPTEVIVVDNGSRDGSGQLAAAAGARVVAEPLRGYGAACLTGFAAASGDYIVMADGDGSYDFADIDRFIAALSDGADFVVGDRRNGIGPGAMSWMNRRIGNPALSGILNLLFGAGVGDAHCGLRAVRRSSLPALALRSTGMEFASEMVIRAGKAGLDVRQIPIRYHARGGTSKLSRWRDGWRHLRLLLVHAPLHLFILPGAVLAALGALAVITVLAQVQIFGRAWYVHTMIGGSLLLIVGTQLLSFGICAQAYAAYFMNDESRWFQRLRKRFRLEHGLILGLVLVVAGVASLATVIFAWAGDGFSTLSQERLAILGSTVIAMGLQVAFCSFLLSVLGLRRQD